MAFSHDGLYVATGGVDKTIKIWDVAEGRELRTLAGHTGGVKAVAFSPGSPAVSQDRSLIASGGNDGRIILWETASGNEVTAFAGHTGAVTSIAFSRDGRWLASGGADFKVKLWNLATRSEARRFDGHYRLITSVAFSPDGAWLASGGADEVIRLWDLSKIESSKPKNLNIEPVLLEGHTGWVRSLDFSPDGGLLASSGADGTARLWRLPKGKLHRTYTTHKTHKAQYPAAIAVAFSADGAQLVVCADDRTIKRYDAATGAELQSLSAGADLDKYETAVFSADGSWLVASSGSRTIELRRVAAGGETRMLESRVNAINAATFSPDGRWFASGNQDMTLTVWDVISGRAVARLDGAAGSVTAIAFSPDSQRLASGGKGGVITIWDVGAAREARRWTAHADGVNALLFTPDGAQLISAGVDSIIRFWDTTTWNETGRLTGQDREIRSLALSNDGKWLVSAGADQTVRLWEIATRAPARTMRGHTGVIFAVAFSADGKMIASAGADRTIRLRDAASGATTHTLTGIGASVYSVAFSPDGKLVVAGGANGEIKVWETASGNQRFNLTGHVGSVNSVCFDADGRWLVSGGEDGSARAWETGTGELAATIVSLRANYKPADPGTKKPDSENSERGVPDWLVVTPDGLFDGSASAWEQLLWRFGRSTYSAAPVELFFNEFYYPELLADVLAGKEPAPAEDISQRDRRQPKVKMSIAGAAGEIANREITVKLDISEAPPDKDRPAGSGARDVRLFRNGSLVKVWRGDVLRGQPMATFICTLPIVAGENRLTAYAFNRDSIKSADETRLVIGAESLRRQGALYLLAVGVNKYANQDFNLRYAVNDAQSFGDEMRRQQTRLSRFSNVVLVTLLDEQATKSNIVAALKRLAGSKDAPPREAPSGLDQLKQAQPEDAVIVYFAGHGMAVEDRFYLIPHDLGYAGRRDQTTEEGLRALIEHSLSDAEMEPIFEGLDAGQLLLILDACNSGQALEAEEKRRGPMNSKGLAQLAYEKGMNILTAAQSYQLAKETSRLEHGYLTYALVEAGLKRLAADYKPRDGQVMLREWLDHASEEVPRMQEERIKAETDRGLRLKLIRQPEAQRPRVFYRRESGDRQMIIARP